MSVDPHRLFDIAGRVAIITGASGGIGTALVEGFSALGAKVFAVDRLEAPALPAGVAFHRADLREPEAVAAIPAAAEAALGPVDILINNAGLGEHVRAEAMSLETWTNTLTVNLTGSFLLAQAVGRGMIARRAGKIVNIASRCGLMGMPFSAAYNASKTGLIGMTNTLAVEWGFYDIQVNAIIPGVVRTPMNARQEADLEEARLYARTIPLGRVSRPGDLVGAAVFLSSPASAYITGASLFVDGGNFVGGGVGTELRDFHLRRQGVTVPEPEL